MDSIVSITPFKLQARDITCDFENACNCCCFGGRPKAPSSKTEVYINSRGVAEKFDHRKAVDNEKALRRSISHLNIIIVNHATLGEKDIQEVLDQIAVSAGISLDADHPVRLTIGLVKRINSAVDEIFDPDNEKIDI